MRLVVGIGDDPERGEGDYESLTEWLRDGGDDWLAGRAPAIPHTGRGEPVQPLIDVNLLTTSGLAPLARTLLSWLAARGGRTKLIVSRPDLAETVEIASGPAEPLVTALSGLLRDAAPDSGDVTARPRSEPPVTPDDVHTTGNVPNTVQKGYSYGVVIQGPVGVTPPGPPFGDDDEDE